MINELQALLGTRQYIGYVNARAQQYADLEVRAKNAEATYLASELRARPVIADITRSLRARITEASTRIERTVSWLGTNFDNSRTPGYRGLSDAQVSDLDQLPANFNGIAAIRFGYTRGTRGNIIRPGGNRFVRVSSRSVKVPAFTEADAQAAIAARLASYDGLSSYREAQAARDAARTRLAGFKILG